jgi:hypothetical protein
MTSSRYLVWLRLAVLSQPNATFPGIFHLTRRTFIINVYRGRQCFAFLSHLPRRLTRGPASGVGTLGPSRDALNWPQHQCRRQSALAPPRACSSSFHQGLPSGWRRSTQSGTFVYHWTLQCCTCTQSCAHNTCRLASIARLEVKGASQTLACCALRVVATHCQWQPR